MSTMHHRSQKSSRKANAREVWITLYGWRSYTKGSGLAFLEAVRLTLVLDIALTVFVRNAAGGSGGKEPLETDVATSTVSLVSGSASSDLTDESTGGAVARMKLSQMPLPTKQTIRGRLCRIFRKSAGTPAVNSVFASSAA